MKKQVISLTAAAVLSGILFSGCENSNLTASAPDAKEPEELAQALGSEGGGYAVCDLNGDGTKELLVGTIGNGFFQSFITQMIELSDSGSAPLFSGSERDRLYLLNRGEFLEEGSSSAYSSFWSVRRFENHELCFLEGIVYDETLSSDYPWFAAEGSGKPGSSISSDEFLERMNTYEGRIQNPYLIAFSGNLSDTFALNGRDAEKIILSVQHYASMNTEVSDPSVVDQFMKALKEVKIGKENDDGTTDSDDVITIFFTDGSTANIRFRQGKLAYGARSECYDISGADDLYSLYEKYSGSSMK